MIRVDEWEGLPHEITVTSTDGALFIPVSKVYNNVNAQSFNIFLMSTPNKRVFNMNPTRPLIEKYINYFMNFYDEDGELLKIYAMLKYYIDYETQYTVDNLINDIHKLIAYSPTMSAKINKMNEDNYYVNLEKNTTAIDVLRYTNEHGKLMMKASLIGKIAVPVLMHFFKVRKEDKIDNHMLSVMIPLLVTENIDLYNKLYKVIQHSVNCGISKNPIWGRQDIKGVTPETKILELVHTIIAYKTVSYKYNDNGVAYNLTIINTNIDLNVNKGKHEYNFISLSSSNRDADNNSEFDKFESYTTKQDESLFLQVNAECKTSLKILEREFGPVSQETIKFYKRNLSDGNEYIINSTQRALVSNLFLKTFGVESIKNINTDEFIMLIVWAKRYLRRSSLIVLPYIVSAKFVRNSSKKVSKKELLKIESSVLYQSVCDLYKNDQAMEKIKIWMVGIANGEYLIVDDEDPTIHNVPLHCSTDKIYHELLNYILLI